MPIACGVLWLFTTMEFVFAGTLTGHMVRMWFNSFTPPEMGYWDVTAIQMYPLHSSRKSYSLRIKSTGSTWKDF